MEALIEGFVPGLPDELRTRILERAEGVPLYAVETVRMLLDRGLVAQEGAVYRPTGPIEALDVPETLHALIAARLDGLEPEERQLLQDASVIGKTFTKQAVAKVGGEPEERLEPSLAALVRKEVLSIQSDPRSPERGQYVFLQDLVRFVAYETLARRDRKVRHLRAAAYLEELFGAGELEVVEVVASHYLAAYESAPDDEDAAGTKAKAAGHAPAAGERAASLAASAEAERYFVQSADLADEPLVKAELYERAGERAAAAARLDEAQADYQRAIELFEVEGATHPAARVSARIGDVDFQLGNLDQALERMERALSLLGADEPDADIAALTTQLGRLHFFKGNIERATEMLEQGLALGEALRLPEVIAQALNSYGCIALARKVGNRQWEWRLMLESCGNLFLIGRWDEVLARAGEIDESQPVWPLYWSTLADVLVRRGELEEAARVAALHSRTERATDVQEQAAFAAGSAVVRTAEGKLAEALESAEEAVGALTMLSPRHVMVQRGFVTALEAAFELERLDKAEQLLARIDAMRPGELTAFLDGHRSRFRARLAAARGRDREVEPGFKAAERLCRGYGLVFWLAVAQLEHGEWLVALGRAEEAEPLFAEARETFEQLEAAPYLERMAGVRAEPAAEAASASS
jgi:tetratricopeptide (TPR) repeat protein